MKKIKSPKMTSSNNNTTINQNSPSSNDKYVPFVSSGNNTPKITSASAALSKLSHQVGLEDSFTKATSTVGDSHAIPTSSNVEEDLNIFVKELLEQMQSKFSDMSVKILGKIEEMGSRIDDLENSINVLVDQTGSTDLDNSFQSHSNTTLFHETSNNNHRSTSTTNLLSER